MNSSSVYLLSARITINGLSVLVCLLAAILVFALRLYRKVVYRLALYQVLASLLLASIILLEVIISTDFPTNSEDYNRLCIAIAWFTVYTQWMKLLFTMWVAFHIFCFAVLHKNLKKLEVMYVVTSLLVPAVIAPIPLITNTYGHRGYCFIYAQNDTHHIAFIEKFALWDGPAMAILTAASTAMVVMTIKLAHRVRWRLKYEPITDGDQHWNALKQLLPLAAYPILFFVFNIPVFIYDIHSSFPAAISLPNKELLIFFDFVFVILWSMSSGVTLVVHISVVKIPMRICRRFFHKSTKFRSTPSSQYPTARMETGPLLNSATSFPLPNGSLGEDEL